MTYNVFVIANAFIELSNKENRTDLTNMKLQKLVYISQGFSLAVRKEELFQEPVHAFQWGPVIPILYQALKNNGKNPINEKIPMRFGDPEIDLAGESIEFAIISAVWRKYGKFTAAQLSTITHEKGSPWEKAWKHKEYGVIETDDIFTFYGGILAD